MMKIPIFHEYTKHINVQYHFICKLIEKGEIQTDHWTTKDELVNSFIKALAKENFYFFKNNFKL